MFLSNPISKLNIRCKYQPGRLIRRLVFIQVQSLCRSLWVFYFFEGFHLPPLYLFHISCLYFPSFPSPTVCFWFSLPPSLPPRPLTLRPLHSLSFLPSFLSSVVEGGGGLVASFWSLLKPLTSGTACSTSSRSADTSTHTFTAFSTGQPGRLPHSQVFDTHAQKVKSFSSFLFSSRFIDAHAEQLTALLSFMQDFLFPFHVFSFCYLAQTVHTLLARMRTCSLMSVQMLFDLV